MVKRRPDLVRVKRMVEIIVMGARLGYDPYEPQLCPVAWAKGVWTVEGPEVGYRLSGVSIPCPTRMTIVRLRDGGLWLHSPVAYSVALHSAVDKLGPVSALIAPSSYHHLHIEKWAAAHSKAQVFATPDLVENVGSGGCNVLGDGVSASWNSEIDSRLVDLGSFKEAIFFHHASRTLIVTDLMQNFEVGRIRSLLIKLLLSAGGATGPNGRPSIEIRQAARGHHRALQSGVQQMIAWHPERIILSHGKCYSTEAVTEIERAFSWLN